MAATRNQRVQKARDLTGVSRAFRPSPLRAEEMEFYSDALNKCRSNPRRTIRADLLESAEQGFFSRVFSMEIEAAENPLRSTIYWKMRRSNRNLSS